MRLRLPLLVASLWCSPSFVAASRGARPFLPLAASSSPSLDYESQTPYYAFPHPPRRGNAFLPPDTSFSDSPATSFPDLEPLNEDVATNPAPMWSRHPLAPRVPLDVSRQPAPPEPGEGIWRDQKSTAANKKRDAITVSPAPYPPAAYIDVNNLTTIAVLAQAVVARMQTWYEAGLYEWTPWWEVPVLGMAYVMLDMALGNKGNQLLATDVLIKNDDQGWMIDKYVDDQSWWAMFALRAYEAYGNETWLEMSKVISDNNTLYWSDWCGGGVLWLTYKPAIQNTITNGLYFNVLTRLYRYTGNYTYYQYSMNTLNWWLGWGLETSTGRVYDTITAPACNVSGLQTWTYNSGAFLYGLADLYYVTGNETLLDLGRTIAYAAIRDFSQEDTGILRESCEHDGQPTPELPPGCQQDEVVFKGILMMGMAELFVARPDHNIYNYINTQLLSVTFNNIDDTFLFGEWWDGPWNETTAGPKTQINALCLLAAAATINSHMLSLEGQNTSVTGYALDQVAVPNNATLTGANGAGSTQRVSPSAASHSLDVPSVSVLGSLGIAVVACLAGWGVLWA